ncbi:MAG TPA: globin-coupled sensor protein, partial [Xanthobacteraceae bacterium]|nr:globin-coupled sensor protein [Xanthobacteraceae bacterium]
MHMVQLAEKLARVRRLAYYRPLSAKDRERLRGLVEKVGSSVLRGLYQTLGTDRELAAKITVPLDGIETRQAAHLAGLISNPDGADYLDRVDLIGRTHVRLAVPPELYLAAYAAILGPLIEGIGRLHPWSGREATKLAAAFVQLTMLDMAMVLAVYDEGMQRQVDARRQKIEAAIKEADKMLTGVFADLQSGARNLHGSVVTLQREAATADETCAAASGVLSDARARLDATANASATFQRSIAEVRESATGAADLAREATQQGVEAREAVDVLTENGKKIDSVVKLISEIAEQTNLLALNATIE